MRDCFIENIDGSIREVSGPDELTRAFTHRWSTRTLVDVDGVEVVVSTVFLVVDHCFDLSGTPVLYETMVFGGSFDDYQRRYCTRAEAIDGHAEVVSMVKSWGRLDNTETE